MKSVRSRFGAVLLGGLTSMLIVRGIIAGWHPRARSDPATGIVVIRGAPITAAKAVLLTPIRPTRVAPTTMPVEAAVADLRRAYPQLSEVAMECRARQCSLIATIRPLVSQNDLDRRQEMLLGGLATALAEDGYRMTIPFDMDEVADNTFHICAHVTADDHP
jgi:hypothetical protein